MFNLKTCKLRGTRIDGPTATELIRSLGLICPDLEGIFGARDTD